MLVNDNSTGAQFAHYVRTAKSLLFGDEDRPGRCAWPAVQDAVTNYLSLHFSFAREPETGLWEAERSGLINGRSS